MKVPRDGNFEMKIPESTLLFLLTAKAYSDEFEIAAA